MKSVLRITGAVLVILLAIFLIVMVFVIKDLQGGNTIFAIIGVSSIISGFMGIIFNKA